MKIKGICKKFYTNEKLIRKELSDRKSIRSIENALYVSESYSDFIKQHKIPVEKPLSELEKIIVYMAKVPSNKDSLTEATYKLDKFFLATMENLESTLKSSKDPKVKEQVEELKNKIQQVISEIRDIVRNYNDENKVKTLILDKTLKLSSNPEATLYNLTNEFSELSGAISEHYNRKNNIKNVLKTIGAIGGVGAIIGGAGYATVNVALDSKSQEIQNALECLYGKDIPEYAIDDYFENGRPKSGSTEKIKKELLSKSMKNIINNRLKDYTDEEIKIDYLGLDYFKSESQEDPREKITYDGFSIDYIINGSEEKHNLHRYNESSFDTKDGSNVTTNKDKEAIEIRKYLEKLSINDTIEILNRNSEHREEFESTLDSPISDITTQILAEKIKENSEKNSVKEDNGDYDLDL